MGGSQFQVSQVSWELQSFCWGAPWRVCIACITCPKAVLPPSPFQSTKFTSNLFSLNNSDSVKRKMPHAKYITKGSKVVSCCVKTASNIMKCFYRQVICCGGKYLSAFNKEDLCYKLCLKWRRCSLYVTLYKKLPSLQLYLKKQSLSPTCRTWMYCILVSNCINYMVFS